MLETFLTIVFSRGAEIVGFPIYQVKSISMVKNQIHIAFHKTGDRLEVIHDKPFQRLPNVSVDVFFSNPEQGVWFGKSNDLYHFDKSFTRSDSLPFQALIRNVSLNNDSILFSGTNFIEDGRGGYKIHLTQDEGTQPLIKYQFNIIWTGIRNINIPVAVYARSQP